MSFDQIINFLLNIFTESSKKDDKQVTINKKFIDKKSNILKVIIPPRGNGDNFVTDFLMKRFSKKGYSSLAYYFDGELLSANVNQALKSFEYIRDEIVTEIKKLKSEYNFERIDLIAPSLGVVSACMIANNNKDINNLFLLVPGSCLASSLWEGIRTRDLRKNYQKEGISENKLQDVWNSLAPKNNIDALNDKNIFIAISKSDEIIPYKFGKEFANLIKNKYPQNTITRENKYLGHYITVGKYYIFDSELLK